MPTRLLLVGWCLLVTGGALSSARAANDAARSRPPNIVYFLADDLGYGDVHALNPERGRIPTPHLDRLAREGMRFTDMHSGSAVCTPTRYGLLTGRYAWRTRLQSGVTWGLSGPLISAGRLTVAELLRQHGYRTFALGKWHLGLGWQGATSDAVEIDDVAVDYARPFTDGPLARGFDRFFGISASLDMAPYVYLDDDRARSAPTRRQTDWFRSGPAAADFEAVEVLPKLTGAAVEYITAQGSAPAERRQPFFLYYALPSPHTPIVVAPAWRGRSGLGEYADFVMQTDGVVGEILAALEKSGLDRDTLVLFTSDNGCSAVPSGAAALEQAGHFPSGPFRGYKADLWEGGHRVPFLARWPGRVPAGEVSEHLGWLGDLLATCAELVGAPVPPTAAEDSVSFLPALLGRAGTPRGPVVHHSISGHFALRDGDWKLLLARGSGGWTSPTEPEATAAEAPEVQLYNLRRDPGERENLAAAEPARVARLAATLARIVADGRSTPGPRLDNDVPVELWKTPAAGVPVPRPSARPTASGR